jgi:hypothetical protein
MERRRKEATNHRDGCVQAPQMSCLHHKSPHILSKRLPTFLQRVVQIPQTWYATHPPHIPSDSVFIQLKFQASMMDSWTLGVEILPQLPPKTCSLICRWFKVYRTAACRHSINCIQRTQQKYHILPGYRSTPTFQNVQFLKTRWWKESNTQRVFRKVP